MGGTNPKCVTQRTPKSHKSEVFEKTTTKKNIGDLFWGYGMAFLLEKHIFLNQVMKNS